MMLTHCGNNVRNRYSGCVFSVKDIVPVPLKTSRNLRFTYFVAASQQMVYEMFGEELTNAIEPMKKESPGGRS